MDEARWDEMARGNRLVGLMAGITLGFAVWGAVKAEPETVRYEAVPAQNAAVTGGQQAEGKEDILNLHSLSAVLIDGDSGRILYGKDEHTVRPMASTTKIMTCILALELGNPDDICTVSSVAASQPKVHLGAPKGTSFYLKDLLYSLMLESHNDSAVVIAEHIGGSVEGFAELMNQKARDIGCKDTTFVTPNGLDASVKRADGTEAVHSTTAADLASILRYCIRKSPKKDEFLEITRTASYCFSDTAGKRSFSCNNHNALLTMMDGALTGKTGFTGGAGYSYVAAVEDGGRTFVAAFLGCGWPPHKTWKWSDARRLFSYGEENYFYRDVYEEPKLTPLPVKNAVRDVRIPLTTGLDNEKRHLNLLLSEEERVECKVETPKVLTAPVHAGDLEGTVTYTLNGETVASYPLYAGASVEQWNFPYCAGMLKSRFLLCNSSAYGRTATESSPFKVRLRRRAGFISATTHSYGLCSKCKVLR